MRWPFSPVSYNTLLNAWCSTTRLSALPARYSGQLLDKFIWSSNLEYLPCAMNLLLLYSFQQSRLVSGPILEIELGYLIAIGDVRKNLQESKGENPGQRRHGKKPCCSAMGSGGCFSSQHMGG